MTDIEWAPGGSALYFLAPDEKSAAEKSRDKAKDDVYAFDENYQQTHLWTADAASGKETRVTSGDYSVFAYTISRDGKKIAFHRAPDPLLGSRDRGEVWVMNADGSGAVQITHNTVGESGAVLSPDDSQVLFTSDADDRFETYYNGRLFEAPAAGGPAHAIAGDDPPLAIDDAAWSADGRRSTCASTPACAKSCTRCPRRAARRERSPTAHTR